MIDEENQKTRIHVAKLRDEVARSEHALQEAMKRLAMAQAALTGAQDAYDILGFRLDGTRKVP